MQRLRLVSPAKVNLGLAVQGKRPDGYHDLETVFQLIDLTDTLILELDLSGAISLSTDQVELPTGEDNLVYQAALLLRRYTRCSLGVKMTLQKVIPVGAGLGGGSSNAAYTLWGLNILWKLDLRSEELRTLAQQLGSDVPFFLFAAQAIGRGRGHDLSPLPSTPPFSVVLLNPGFSLSTAEVYGRYKLRLTNRENRITMLTHFLQTGNTLALGRHLFNDLESAVLDDYPVIKEMKEALLTRGATGAIMSGSGPTVFGLFADMYTAQEALVDLQEKHHGWWSRKTTTIHSLDSVWQRVRWER